MDKQQATAFYPMSFNLMSYGFKSDLKKLFSQCPCAKQFAV